MIRLFPGQNYVTAVDGHVFSAVVYGAADREFYSNPISLKLASTECEVSVQVEGDGVDNDCDESTDEEICNGLGKAYRTPGNVNEFCDCIVITAYAFYLHINNIHIEMSL